MPYVVEDDANHHLLLDPEFVCNEALKLACLKPAIGFWFAGYVAGFAENVCEQLATRQALWLKCGELLCVCSLARYLLQHELPP